MKRLSGFMASLALVASANAAPAFAADSHVSAASKLSLVGAAGAMDNKCVKRDSFDGKWRLDQAAGSWVRCGGSKALYIVGGLAAAGGIAAAAASGGSKSP